jgi:hypothetical protein
VDPKLFRSRVFTSANITIVLGATIFGIELLALSLFLQQSWHWSTTSTGLAIAPGPAAILLFSFVAQKMNERFPVGAVVASGFAVIVVGQILMVLSLHSGIHSYAGGILPGWLVISLGFGFTIPTVIGSATVDLPPEQSATGSAVVNSGRQIGGVFGSSIVVVVLGSAEVTGAPSRFYDLWWIAAALCAAAIAVAFGLTPTQKTPSSDPAAAIEVEEMAVALADGVMP